MKALVFFILIVNPMQPPNPMLGPNNDWAPLKAEYSACAETSADFFIFTRCEIAAYNQAINPVTNA